MPHALIVDDEADFAESLKGLVEAEGFSVSIAGTLADARADLVATPPNLVIADLHLPDGSGLELLRDCESVVGCDIVMVSGEATVDSAVQALRRGALDYLTKPIDRPRLKSVLTHVRRSRELKEEIGTLREELRKLGRYGPLIGASSAMQTVYDLIAKVSPTDVSVFVTGESGTGKELVAETIHLSSRRRKHPFLPINCGALPPSLIESELFGHEKGSFTGAAGLRRGYFETASEGTLFLDEITEMPIELQVKLLRVLETGTIQRVGGTESIRAQPRIVAATNRSPEAAVKDGKLREDLYYRLHVFPITLPPLRERDDDVILLAEGFLAELNETEKTSKRFDANHRARLLGRLWPGNVRELRNEVQRAYILAEEFVEIPGAAEPAPPAMVSGDSTQSFQIGSSLAEIERQVILATLAECGGDKRKAASILGISLKTLYNRLNVYVGVERTTSA